MINRSAFLLLAAAGLVTAPVASAQMSPFVAVGLGFDGVTTDQTLESTFNPGPPPETATSGKSNFTGQLEGGLRFGAGNTVLGLGLYVQPFTLKADDTNDGAGNTTKTDVKTLAGLFGELGWKLGSSTVAYGRLSYSQGKLESKITNTTTSATPSSGTLSKNFTGPGIGAGMRQSLGGKMYLLVDWHHVFGSEVKLQDNSLLGTNVTVKIKPSITTGLIGLGWDL